LIEFLLEHSEFLNKEENRWMQSVIEVVRKTSLFFQPQIRTKIMNEGWASYWHEQLFLQDERIKGTKWILPGSMPRSPHAAGGLEPLCPGDAAVCRNRGNGQQRAI
jgi:hypothetical protein